MSGEWKENNVSDQANQFEASSSDEPSPQKTGPILETKVMPPPASIVTQPVDDPVKLNLRKAVALYESHGDPKTLASMGITLLPRKDYLKNVDIETTKETKVI